MIQKRFFSRHFSYLTIFFPAYFLVAFLCHTILWSWHSSQSKTVSPTRKRYPICISSFPQVLFRKFAVFFNNWIICCVFLPSTWSPERGKQGVGISPEKKINKLSFVKVFGEFAQLFLLVFYRTFPMRVRFGWTEIEDLLLPLSWIIVL